MGIFDIFKKKSGGTNDNTPPSFSEMRATQNGDGSLSFVLIDEVSGTTAPFPRIDILLRDTTHVEQTKQTMRKAGAGDKSLPIAPIVTDGVAEVLGLDTGQSFTIMSEDSLRAEGLTYELARKGAMARLRAAAADLTVEGGNGRFRAAFKENLDLSASFMLLPDAWLDLSAIQGAPVFAVGTRVSIHVCGSEDAASLTGMKQIAEKMYEESLEDPAANGRPLTSRLLTLQDGQIVPFLVN